jgi:glycosyltransferase involved in cell wall biosynthesis
MKLLVFAHVPPPHHGQSYMVQLMLTAFGGDHRKRTRPPSENVPNAYNIKCYHVNAQVSKSLEDIGKLQIGKVLLILFYCLQAIWCRFRYGVTNLYYVPAPGKSVALQRDWLVMLICRPFFKNIILHWHAAGLAKWLETSVQIRTRAITYRAFKQPDLSIVISKYNVADAEKLLSRRIRDVDYGIPDPCPDFENEILPRRRARFAARKKLLANERLSAGDLENTSGDPESVRVLYLAHYMREKGLFAAAEAVVLANRMLRAGKSGVRLKLIAAGDFVTNEEKLEFDRLQEDPEFAGAVECLGFISGARKENALREADLFCFPTRYAAENQPVTLIEAMAFGLPIVTTRWRSLPEMLPPGYPGLVATQSPEQIANALLALAREETGEELRQTFSKRYTLQRHLAGLADALASVEQPVATVAPAVATLPA